MILAYVWLVASSWRFAERSILLHFFLWIVGSDLLRIISCSSENHCFIAGRQKKRAMPTPLLLMPLPSLFVLHKYIERKLKFWKLCAFFPIINRVQVGLLVFRVNSRHLIVDGGRRGGACTYSNMAVCGGRNVTAAFRPYDSFLYPPAPSPSNLRLRRSLCQSVLRIVCPEDSHGT